MTYTRVAHGVTPPELVARTHSAKLDKFLFDHYEALRSKATKSDSPMASFVDTDVQKLIADMEASINEANAFINKVKS